MWPALHQLTCSQPPLRCSSALNSHHSHGRACWECCTHVEFTKPLLQRLMSCARHLPASKAAPQAVQITHSPVSWRPHSASAVVAAAEQQQQACQRVATSLSEAHRRLPIAIYKGSGRVGGGWRSAKLPPQVCLRCFAALIDCIQCSAPQECPCSFAKCQAMGLHVIAVNTVHRDIGSAGACGTSACRTLPCGSATTGVLITTERVSQGVCGCRECTCRDCSSSLVVVCGTSGMQRMLRCPCRCDDGTLP